MCSSISVFGEDEDARAREAARGWAGAQDSNATSPGPGPPALTSPQYALGCARGRATQPIVLRVRAESLALLRSRAGKLSDFFFSYLAPGPPDPPCLLILLYFPILAPPFLLLAPCLRRSHPPCFCGGFAGAARWGKTGAEWPLLQIKRRGAAPLLTTRQVPPSGLEPGLLG